MSAVPPIADKPIRRVNLCCGPIHLEGYINVDLSKTADVVIDLEKELLPFPDQSIDVVVCISAINYFTRQRGEEIIRDVQRALKPGGIARFASQDLRILSAKYLSRDREFYFQKLPDGRERLPGRTFADKFNAFFYGFETVGKHCKYVYDYETLASIFTEAGFGKVSLARYRESAIPGIESIDNRPEQMFFLEAVKTPAAAQTGIHPSAGVSRPEPVPDVRGVRDSASALWAAGKKEQAWQLFLKALQLNFRDREVVLKCGDILLELKRFTDADRLYSAYLKMDPGDREIVERLGVVSQRRQAVPGVESVPPAKRTELYALNQRVNAIHPDGDHLAACAQWLRTAQSATGGRGVSASYNLLMDSWEVADPETTGYIIPTLLQFARLSKREDFRKWAGEMGDWEIDIQSPEGGAGEPVGVYGLQPRVFNTSHVMLGWLALFQETKESRYLDAARKAGDWIVASQDEDGKWSRSTYRGPRSYKVRVAWALLELHFATQDVRYRSSAEKAIAWTLNQARPSGWFANTSLTEAGKPWTHLIGYTLVGLAKICRMNGITFDRESTLQLLERAAEGICRCYRMKRQEGNPPLFGLPGTLDESWWSMDNDTSLTGNAQLAFFLREMSFLKGNAEFVMVADGLVNDLKQLQLMDGITNPNFHGALAGSYPIGTGYCAHSLPNWGTKFFADCLIQKQALQAEWKFLG